MNPTWLILALFNCPTPEKVMNGDRHTLNPPSGLCKTLGGCTQQYSETYLLNIGSL